ncbi:MAG: DUF885 domain-containing protein [Candidatus Eremiobacteraeota bacterium]|nr:DUF885 domain-containing protein [Candidatus Eremiobacteraeota bacterium]
MIRSIDISARSCTLVVALLCAILGPGAAAARADEAASLNDRLQALAKDMTFEWAKRHPLIATGLGITGEDGALDVPSPAENTSDLNTIRAWKAKLGAISLADATLVQKDDAALLRAQLIAMERQYTVYKAYEKDYSAPAQAIVGAIFTQFQHLPNAGPGGAKSAALDGAWEDIIARLAGSSAYIRAGETLVTHPGHLQGVVATEQLAGVPDFFNGALTGAAKSQLSPERFARFVVARDASLGEITKTKTYIDAHVSGWPENYAMGRAAYEAMLRDEQLLPFTAADIVQMAKDELGHGWAEQTWVESEALNRGTPIGPQSGGGLAPSGAALVGYYRDRIAQLRTFMNAHRVIDVPAWLGRIDVVETPKFLQPISPGASMNPPLLFSPDTTGFYFITPPVSLSDAAQRLDPNQDFDKDRILETAAHEAMPGHFLQLSIARRHSDFVRKIQDSSVFAEGWAFYGEEMFWQLGLYDTQDLDARYDAAQWERVRGARAIVDSELAGGDWSFDRAAAYFAQQTGFPPEQAKAAVSGIALGPGYVISYTVGRFQLESLLGLYRAHMGSRASLDDFHQRLLCYGTTPFAIVEPELLADLDKPLSAVRAAANY